MTIFDVLWLICGICLFLYGMNVMGDALKKSAGNKLKIILGNLTSNPFKGFLLGLTVTMIIQSSSATTVMVVGFVNSGTMLLTQAVGVIMGANVGTAITAWLTALAGIEGGDGVSSILNWLKPSSWMPVLALIGLALTMFAKRSRHKDFGAVFLGFAVLMVGMDVMGDSVAGLQNSEAFQNMLVMFKNPFLGMLSGLVLTAIVQSSSASVGILQALTVTGAISYGTAIPIIIGQNIGACVTPLLSAISANKNGKRAAFVYLYFNVIGALVAFVAFVIADGAGNIALFGESINMWGVAIVHTAFKIFSAIIIAPFTKYLERLAVLSVKDGEETETEDLLDERLLVTPSVAIARCNDIAGKMAEISCEALLDSFELLLNYDEKKAGAVRRLEDKADVYEDALGSYLVKLSAHVTSETDTKEVTRLLHAIGDFERISDHAVNLVESAEEINDKKLVFSDNANIEIATLRAAVTEIVGLARSAFLNNDVELAKKIEPLEEVIDRLRDEIKLNHIMRVQKNECTIEHGFVLSDILTNFERVADHCSNIASCVIEISHNTLDMHRYISSVKNSGGEFERATAEYAEKYSLARVE